MRNELKCLFILLCFTTFCQCANGQAAKKFNFAKLFNEKKLTVIKREAKLQKDGSREYIVLNEDVDEGLVWIDGESFSTGTVEIDLKGQDVYQHSFLGIAFHGANDSTFDAIYFRPFQFNTADSVRKTRAIQYVSLPNNTWQVLREKHPGVYEKTVNPAPDPNNWFHAKIVVTKSNIMVYVNGAANPCISVDIINNRKTGRIALYTADRSGGSFANLSISNK